MSWHLIDFKCKNLEGESFGHMFSRTNDFCCYLSHRTYTQQPINKYFWESIYSNSPQYTRKEDGYIQCQKPCKYCIMDFVLKRLVKLIITRYRRVKKYKDHLSNIKNLHKREIIGKNKYFIS